MAACPRKRCDTTPCVITDGVVAYAMNQTDKPICVGCEASPKTTGVPVDPEIWKRTVDRYYKEHPQMKPRGSS